MFILETEVEEFVLNTYTDLKDVHAATIFALDDQKLITSFFGKTQSESGKTEENNSIWVSLGHKNNNHYQWTVPERIVSPQYFRDHHIPLKQDNGIISCANPVITFFKNQLLIFSKIGPNPRTWSGILSRSYDQGLTWQEPELLHGILGPARNMPLIYENNILSPCSRESCIDDFPYIEHSLDFHAWNVSNPILPNPQVFQNGYRGFIQPTLVSGNSPNKIIMLVRPRKTDPLISTCIHRSESVDKGIHWSYLQPVNLVNPDSAIDAINISNHTLLLAYNRVTYSLTSRNILSLALSTNEGLNWNPITIQNSTYPKGDIEYSNIQSEEYSYPSIIINREHNEIHVIYTFNRINLKHKVFKLLTK